MGVYYPQGGRCTCSLVLSICHRKGKEYRRSQIAKMCDLLLKGLGGSIQRKDSVEKALWTCKSIAYQVSAW